MRLSDVEKALSLPPEDLQKEDTLSITNQTSVDLTHVLEFIRYTDPAIWDQLIHEMKTTHRSRNVDAAGQFNVGNQVAYESPDRSDSFRGVVLRISRAGQLIVGVTSEDGALTKHIVPASYVKRVA